MKHQVDPHALPDSDFEPGRLEHLVVGNRGRLLDPRRTPVSISAIDTETGHVHIRIEAFEDRGAVWEIPFEGVSRYQFETHGSRAPGHIALEYEDVARRLNQPLVIDSCETARTETENRISEEFHRAAEWLKLHSRFFKSRGRLSTEDRRGYPDLWLDLQDYLESSGWAQMEAAFAARFVSNPYSGELVKGHRIVLAELGLADVEDTLVRSPKLFDGAWSKDQRAHHICVRLGFVRAMFARSGIDTLRLYRGLCYRSWPPKETRPTFVSTSSDKSVAESCSGEQETGSWGLVLRAPVPVRRVFMSYFETAAMNRQFEEAEVVLLHKQGSLF